jgi:hypothetical protein
MIEHERVGSCSVHESAPQKCRHHHDPPPPASIAAVGTGPTVSATTANGGGVVEVYTITFTFLLLLA